MKKRIVICADGTWNRPETNLKKDFPTNVLRTARAILPYDRKEDVAQVVFYDWGIGSYYGSVKGGALGDGINKNICDCYRFIVHNYNPGDELYFFGFSRGAYTVRSLAGFINNCSILKRKHANRINDAFSLYKDRDIHPDDDTSTAYRQKYAVAPTTRIHFIGVWDTVGSLGIPVRMFGFLNEKHLFHDNKIGPNIDCARHAMALDELRNDFKPTIWRRRRGMDLKQVWFAGVHGDIGGGYKPDKGGASLSNIPLSWMQQEAELRGLKFESHLAKSKPGDPLATQHEEYEGFYKILGKHNRSIPASTFIHPSVRIRYESSLNYEPRSLKRHIAKYSWNRILQDFE